MTRLALLAVLSTLIADPALAQVINGETPLDETTLNREVPGPADQKHVPTTPPSAAAPQPSPSEAPQAVPRRD